MAPPRPLVTDAERQVLQGLASTLHKDSQKGISFCSGTIDDIGISCPSLFYALNQDERNAQVLRIPQDGDDAYETLHDVSVPSAFGRGKELVLDESYRAARELHPDRFALNFDPFRTATGVLENVESMCMTPVIASLYKLNSYVKGGFFKPHRDTPKAENHIGTLLVGIPTAFKGGELLLRHEEGQIITRDWSDATKFSWVFFYSDVEHEILPVILGHRLTIAYDVFTSGAQIVSPILERDRLNYDWKLLPLFYQIETQVVRNAEFLPNGGRLAFRLIHQYPLSNESWAKNFSRALKGMDALLHKIFTENGMDPALFAAYQVPSRHLTEGEGAYDEFSTRFRGHYRTLLFSKSFQGLKGWSAQTFTRNTAC